MTLETFPLTAHKPLRHTCGAPYTVLGTETPSRCEQTERVCTVCELVKITVHQPNGEAYREWRYPGSKEQTRFSTTPIGCVAKEEVA